MLRVSLLPRSARPERLEMSVRLVTPRDNVLWQSFQLRPPNAGRKPADDLYVHIVLRWTPADALPRSRRGAVKFHNLVGIVSAATIVACNAASFVFPSSTAIAMPMICHESKICEPRRGRHRESVPKLSMPTTNQNCFKHRSKSISGKCLCKIADHFYFPCFEYAHLRCLSEDKV